MRFLANENIPLASIEILRYNAYDVLAIGQDFAGYLDYEVIQLAIKEKRTIIILDSDYGELIFKKGYKPEQGVIYIRWKSYTPEEIGEYLSEFFKYNKLEYRRALTVIGRNDIRQRKY